MKLFRLSSGKGIIQRKLPARAPHSVSDVDRDGLFGGHGDQCPGYWGPGVNYKLKETQLKILPLLIAALATVACILQQLSSIEPGTPGAATLATLPTATLLSTPILEPSGIPTKQVDTEAFSVQVDPSLPASMTYSNFGITSVLDFPAGSTRSTITVTLIPELASSPDTGLLPTGHAFVLLISQGEQLHKGFVFEGPVTITTNYREGTLDNEPSVQLLWWSGERWQDPGSNCALPAETLWDPDTNTIRASTCLPGAFALFTSF